MCLKSLCCGPAHSQSVHNSQVDTADTGRETLAFPCPLRPGGACEHWCGGRGTLKRLRFTLWFPFPRAPGWWWITSRVLHSYLLLHGQIWGELCSWRKERTGQVLLLWWQVVLAVLLCLWQGYQITLLKEWYKWKNLGECFGTTYKKGKVTPTCVSCLGMGQLPLWPWGSQPRAQLQHHCLLGCLVKAIFCCARLRAPILHKLVTWSLVDLTCSFRQWVSMKSHKAGSFLLAASLASSRSS